MDNNNSINSMIPNQPRPERPMGMNGSAPMNNAQTNTNSMNSINSGNQTSPQTPNMQNPQENMHSMPEMKPPHTNIVEPKKSHNKIIAWLLIVFGLIILLAIGGYYLYLQNQTKIEQQKKAQEEATMMMEKEKADAEAKARAEAEAAAEAEKTPLDDDPVLMEFDQSLENEDGFKTPDSVAKDLEDQDFDTVDVELQKDSNL